MQKKIKNDVVTKNTVTLDSVFVSTNRWKVHRILKTLSEIQRILCLGDDFHTAKEILRLHNCSFEHFLFLKDVVCMKNLIEKMTSDRFFGKYQHNLCSRSLSVPFK